MKRDYTPLLVLFAILGAPLFGGLLILFASWLSGTYDPFKKYERVDPTCPPEYETYFYNHGVRCRKEVK